MGCVYGEDQRGRKELTERNMWQREFCGGCNSEREASEAL